METKNLRKVEADLLISIFRDLEQGRVAGRLPFQRRLVRLDISRWSGEQRPQPATRMAYSRSLKALHEAGLLVRVSSGGERTTHVQLTRAGNRLAQQLRESTSHEH